MLLDDAQIFFKDLLQSRIVPWKVFLLWQLSVPIFSYCPWPFKHQQSTDFLKHKYQKYATFGDVEISGMRMSLDDAVIF